MRMPRVFQEFRQRRFATTYAPFCQSMMPKLASQASSHTPCTESNLSVKSSDNVFGVLDYLSRCNTPVSGAEIAAALGIPLTSMVRAMSTLEAAGYALRANGQARFELGDAGQMLTYSFMSQFPVRNAALPYLQQLTSLSGHSCSLFQRVGRYAVRIAFIAGSAAIINLSPLGEAQAFSDGAAGLVFLAYEDASSWAHAASAAYPSDRLGALLERARRQGHVRASSGHEQGGYDLAFPLFPALGSLPVAAVMMEGVPAGVQDADIQVWSEVIDRLQAMLQADQNLLVSPYAHVEADSIDLDSLRRHA